MIRILSIASTLHPVPVHPCVEYRLRDADRLALPVPDHEYAFHLAKPCPYDVRAQPKSLRHLLWCVTRLLGAKVIHALCLSSTQHQVQRLHARAAVFAGPRPHDRYALGEFDHDRECDCPRLVASSAVNRKRLGSFGLNGAIAHTSPRTTFRRMEC